MLSSTRHNIPNTSEELLRDILVKKVGHGIDEDARGFAPMKRGFK
jgi:hypothetical protein